LGDTPLLSALVEQGRPKLHNAIDQLVKRKVLTRKPDDDLQRWGLHEYMKVAAELKLVNQDALNSLFASASGRSLDQPSGAAVPG